MRANVLKKSLTLLLSSALLLASSAVARARSGAAQDGAASARAGEAARRPFETVRFESKLVGASLDYNVILPADYAREESKQKRYPVLYLLHGLGGGAGDWVSSRARLAEHAASYPFIIVTPEGRDGWYTDSATVPAEKFESYFVRELIEDVERRFRAAGTREGRAIAGLSMGGYGALKFGFKYPELFAFAASMSGALRAASWKADGEIPAFLKPSIARVFGPEGSDARRANDLFRIARELPEGRVASLPFFYLDCGTEDYFFPDSRDFSALLLEKKIPHEFRQMPGAHGWPYWDRQVREVLRVMSQRLAPARDASRLPK